MKKFFSVVFGIVLASFLNAQSGKVKDLDISYKTKKPLSSGANEFMIKLSKNGTPIQGAKVSLKAIMPPMPSMPKMDFKSEAKENNGVYEATINLPHGGTWQLRFDIRVDGKKYTYKSSIDF